MTAYKFATDSESGTIEAASFDEARGMLDAMVTDTDGGFGWVEDVDGFRYETTGEATVDDIGNGYFEAADGTVIYSPESA